MANYFYSFLSYFNKDKETKRSKEIDRRLRKDRITSCKILLIGSMKAGKSTVFKQFQLQHLGKFSEEIQRNKKYQIRNDLMYKFCYILEEMKTFSPPIKLDNPENQTKAQWFIGHRWDLESNYSLEFYDCIKILYKDLGVQQALERKRRDEYCLVDNLIYFLDKVDVISKEDYVPTNQDILRYHERHAIDYINFRDDNWNWDFVFLEIRCCFSRPPRYFLDDIDAIVFVADCSYDKKPLHDCNSLQHSLDMFKAFANTLFYRCSRPIILFLNKIDIFEQKFVSDKSKFEEYFPEFRNFTLPNIDETNRYSEVLKAKYFIKHKFEMCWNLRNNNSMPETFYHHFTCAIDTVNIQQIFATCFTCLTEKAFTFSLL